MSIYQWIYQINYIIYILKWIPNSKYANILKCFINSNFLYKILLIGDSGVGKSCIILQYTENNFSQNLMNSIGVDFKLKTIEVDGKVVKLQIVSITY